MKNIIVVSFTDEAKAIDALHKLDELDSTGDISIYEKIMVRKKTYGEYEILKEDSFEGWRTLTGMGFGSLLGLLGGPVGYVIGLYTGTAIGAIADLGHYDFADDFIAKTKNKLAPGTVSIIAEIDEDNDAFIDTSLKPFDAVITRSDIDFEFDNYANEQVDKIGDDIAEQRAALKRAIGNDKMKIQNKIAELKLKRKATISEFLVTAHAAKNNIKDKTTAALAKVKSNTKELAANFSNEVNEEKAAWIKRKIAKHEDRLKNLNKQLKELTPRLLKQD
jgi:uncharacterized membrane protein